MKKPILLLAMLSSLIVSAQEFAPQDTRAIILSQSGKGKPHMIEATDPAANLKLTTCNLVVNLDNEVYSSYSVRLTPSDGGCDIVVPATSATVSIPITDTTTDYVITVDGGDYGTYDGVFSPSGHSTITLSDTQAMQLVKNRRDSNHDINVYTATVNSLVNDPHYCRIDSLPNYTWATDNSAKKLIL